MAWVRIPQGSRPVLAWLAQLSQPDFAATVDSLRVEEPLLARRDLTKRLLNNVPSLDEDGVSSFLDLALGLATLRVDRKMTVAELAQDVSASGDVEISDELRPELRSRLEALLELPSVQQLAKAADLLLQSERVFHDARVVTDVRPIFADDASDGPLGAMIMHNLAISFHGGRELESWYVTLDERDLIKFRQVIDRAVEKGASLHRFMGTAHLSSFEPTE